MKISKSWFLRICLIAGLVLSAQFGFARDPSQVPIPPDNTPLPPIAVPRIMTMLHSASATISDTKLVVYSDYSVGNASITMCNTDNNML